MPITCPQRQSAGSTGQFGSASKYGTPFIAAIGCGALAVVLPRCRAITDVTDNRMEIDKTRCSFARNRMDPSLRKCAPYTAESRCDPLDMPVSETRPRLRPC